MPIRVRICNDCSARFDVFCRDARNEYIHMDTGDITTQPQCACGSISLRPGVGRVNLVGLGDEAGYGKIYPYYDRSLQMRIHNKKHHDQVMKARGLAHYTEADIDAAAALERREHEEIDAWADDYDDRLQNAPEFRQFREMRDKGAMTDHLPPELREKGLKSLGVTDA